MSATGRGSARVADDAYLTPSWCIERLLDEVELTSGSWLEPCAADGSLIRTVTKWYSNNQPARSPTWVAAELRPECRESLLATPRVSEVVMGDFLHKSVEMIQQHPAELGRRFHVILTNPPYRYALPFVQQSMKLADEVCMLLRVSFLESKGRCDWLRQNPPDVYVLPNRPPFKNDGKTDNCAYAWMVWRRDRSRKSGEIRLLQNTSLKDRKK
jgi:hypothetical protein